MIPYTGQTFTGDRGIEFVCFLFYFSCLLRNEQCITQNALLFSIIYYNKCILNDLNLHICIFIKVTTKGAGLNPNAQVWQEIPSHQDDVPEWAEDTTWLLTYPPAAVMSEGMDI